MSKINIGVVTWYKRGHNYGSSLQAYAMQQYLKNQNYNVQFINYNQEHKNIILKFKTKIKKLYLYITNKKIIIFWKKYDKWVKENINESKHIKNYQQLEEYSKKYDIAICGSDQIWNNDLKCEPFYFLQFINKHKRIAYAPSIGRNYIDTKLEDKYKNYISEIPHVSIRENTGKQLLNSVLKLQCEVVLDPTFLLSKGEWERLIDKSNTKQLKDKYVLVYLLEPRKEQTSDIEKFAKKNNLKIVMPVVNPYFKNKNTITVNQFEFLNYIRFAEYVITDSFHGMAFSITFNKQFIIYKRFKDNELKSQNSRIIDLTKLLNINEVNIVNSNLSNMTLTKINYSDVNKKLNKEREKSINYLNKSIDEVITRR